MPRDFGHGLEHQVFAAGHGGLHLALRVHPQRHGDLRAQHRLYLVKPAGHPQVLHIELVRIGHAEVPQAVGGAVAVLPLEAAERNRLFAIKYQFTHRPRQRDGHGQGDGLQRLHRGGRAPVGDLQAVDVELREAQTAREQGVEPEAVVQRNAHPGGLHDQFVALPLQLPDLAAVAQAALHIGHGQRARARALFGHVALSPANGLGERARCTGPHPERNSGRQHQAQQGTRQPDGEPAETAQRTPQPALPRCGGVCGCRAHGARAQKVKPTLRCRRKRLVSRP